ncbi:Putative signal transducing protein [Bryocella elongata]|uniref:Putative signal transducing protein n=1 Tax=Bryocella elongata TaxID=863522 RepID=A0A1H6AJ83_9BACT|nr:DUF2007 domain-containing protein [Bryocella elongata]SEG48799.1 Putative signal transducing protein [Bryocella elongata]
MSLTPETTSDEQLVTVGTFTDLAGAGLAKSALESAGIPALLRSANANSLMPFAFESQVQVRVSDESAARELLESAEDTPPTEAEVTAAEETQETLSEEGTED